MKPISTTEKIWNQEQVTAAQNTINFLSSNFVKVREKAFKILQKLDNSIPFNSEGKKEVRDQAIESWKEWLSETKTSIKKKEKEVKERLPGISKKEGNLYTLKGCENLQDIVDEMMFESHPVILKEYLKLLKNRGCKVFDFDVNARSADRKKVLYKIADYLYDQKQKLKKAALEGQEKLKTFK